ncbi:MAG: hypothetical protein M1527_02950, partial [Gammaproteobacteria bacterium]|nr:hypothetical protein [Gammaproteobacteria bacterium]
GYARLFALPETELIALYERQAAPSAVSLHPLQTTRYDKSEKTTLIMRAGCAITLLVLFAGAGFWLMQYTPWRDEPPVMSTVAEAPDRAKAERYFREALRISPNLPESLYQMALLSYEAQNYPSARAYLQRYAGAAQHTPRSLWLGIRVERELGDKNALASYSLLLKGKFPESEEARLLLQETGMAK